MTSPPCVASLLTGLDRSRKQKHSGDACTDRNSLRQNARKVITSISPSRMRSATGTYLVRSEWTFRVATRKADWEEFDAGELGSEGRHGERTFLPPGQFPPDNCLGGNCPGKMSYTREMLGNSHRLTRRCHSQNWKKISRVARWSTKKGPLSQQRSLPFEKAAQQWTLFNPQTTCKTWQKPK